MSDPMTEQPKPPQEHIASCDYCRRCEKDFAHLKNAGTGAWDFRKRSGFWAGCNSAYADKFRTTYADEYRTKSSTPAQAAAQKAAEDFLDVAEKEPLIIRDLWGTYPKLMQKPLDKFLAADPLPKPSPKTTAPAEPPKKWKLKSLCAKCGEEINEAHSCKVILTKLEERVLPVAMLLDVCDHFCCGMTPIMCRTKKIISELAQHGLNLAAAPLPKAEAPRIVQSKSEYKRLSSLGVDVVPPAASAEAPLGAEAWWLRADKLMRAFSGGDGRLTVSMDRGDRKPGLNWEGWARVESYCNEHIATLRSQLEKAQEHIAALTDTANPFYAMNHAKCYDDLRRERNDLQLKLEWTVSECKRLGVEGRHAEEAEGEPFILENKRAETAERQLSVVREALRSLYEETADYIRVNNLGDVHHNASMKQAEAALSGASPAPALAPKIILDDTLPPNEIRLFSGKSGTRIVDLEMPAPALQEEKTHAE